MFKSRRLLLAGVAIAVLLVSAIAEADQRYGFGRAPSAAEIAGWNIDVRGDGAGLPPGHASVAAGEQLYATKCASCHGDFGEGNGRMPELAGGRGTLAKSAPVKTVGSYWPFAPPLFDYIRRAMPFTAPQSLTNDEVYAVTAYVLYLNNLVPKDATLDAKSLAAIKMPNRAGFITHDVRPDVHNVACMTNCKPGGVRITSDLAKQLRVTPGQEAAASPAAAPAATIAAAATTPTFAQVQPIIAQRCAVCHSAKPTQAGFTSAPGGLKLDTFEQVHAAAKAINQQAVATRGMPLGNLTHMTQSERTLLGRWIASGANL